MEGTDDFVADEQSLGEIEAEVGALALDGVDFSLLIDDQNGVLWLGAHQKLPDFAVLEVVFGFENYEFLAEVFGC